MCEETMRAGRALLIGKTLPDRMLLHMSYFVRAPSPGVRRTGRRMEVAECAWGYRDIRTCGCR